MQRGDIITIPIPYTDLSSHKLRAAVVLSNEQYNKFGTLVVAGIFGNAGVEAYSIPIGPQDLIGCILNKQSYIRFQNIFCLHSSLIHSTLGSLDTKFLDSIARRYISYIS